jgi:excisionase family DNA binding protein
MSEPRLLTIKELSKLLSISTRSILRRVAEGTLPRPIRIGASVRWNHAEISRWINGGCQPFDTHSENDSDRAA